MSKNLEKLNEEIRQAETQLAQEKHKVQRLENRIKHLEKGERKKRTPLSVRSETKSMPLSAG